MATVTSGTLITTDPPARVILKHLNESLPPHEQFIVKELDNTHLVIKSDQLPFVQDLLRQHLEQNTYTKSADDAAPAGRARKGKGRGGGGGAGGGGGDDGWD